MAWSFYLALRGFGGYCFEKNTRTRKFKDKKSKMRILVIRLEKNTPPALS